MNGPGIFLGKGTNVYQRLRSNNFVIKYVLPEVSFVVPKKAAYLGDKAWAKVMKVLAPCIRKVLVINVACF